MNVASSELHPSHFASSSSLPEILIPALSLHSAWKIPWMEEPGRLQSMGSLRVRHDWATSLSLFTFMHWRRKWQPAPVFLPGESQGPGSLVGCHLWGRTESDTTEQLSSSSSSSGYSSNTLSVSSMAYYPTLLHLFLCSDCSSIGLWELFQVASLSLCHIPIIWGLFLSTSSFLTLQDVLCFPCIFPVLILESAVSPRSPGGFCWK